MSNQKAAKDLELFLSQTVPIVNAAGLTAEGYDGDRLSIRAPLDKNINDKGTAFGGSLYLACVSAGWGMTHLKCKEQGLDGDLVIGKGEIDYLMPLVEDIHAVAIAPEVSYLREFSKRFKSKGKAGLEVKVEVRNAGGQLVASFKGKYAIIS